MLCLLTFAPQTHATITNLVLSSRVGSSVTNAISISSGQTARAIRTAGPIQITHINEIIYGIRIEHAGTEYQNAPNTPFIIYGPALIEFVMPNAGQLDNDVTALLVLDLEGVPVTPQPALSVTNIPSNAVVIPADATGPVQIILESSVDLITWNAALPGTYAGSTTNRFFRVRAIRQ